MGLDGGTIPSRADILRRSSWRLANADKSRSTRGGNVDHLINTEGAQVNKQEQARIKWTVCSLSGAPLVQPVVACDLGRLYNRVSVVEFLLRAGMFAHNHDELKKNGFGHIKSLKSVFELQLTKNPALDKSKTIKSEDTTSTPSGLFICPITQLETNGHYPFSVLRTCRHVFSEKALNQLQGSTACWMCNIPFTKDDIIPINASDEAVADLEKRMQQRNKEQKEKKKKEKKGKKRKKENGEAQQEDKTINSQQAATTATTTTTSTTSVSTEASSSTDINNLPKKSKTEKAAKAQ
jgi:hypothetical protein